MAEIKCDVLQSELEDALWLETTPEEITNTDYGVALLKWLQKRRRMIKKVFRILRRVENG